MEKSKLSNLNKGRGKKSKTVNRDDNRNPQKNRRCKMEYLSRCVKYRWNALCLYLIYVHLCMTLNMTHEPKTQGFIGAKI